MKSITGIFNELDKTTKAVAKLRDVISDNDINVLTPATTRAELGEISTDNDMSPVGAPLGATLGAALGLASVIAIPGIGPVTAIGAAWSLAFGTMGGVAGWMVGDRADHALSAGIPTEELFFYEEAIRAGHSVVIVMARDPEQESAARAIFHDADAADIDAARQTWWVGLRDAEWADWEAHNESRTEFEEVESDYLLGFTAALRPDMRGRELDEVRNRLKGPERQVVHAPAFERGFERGQRYLIATRRAEAILGAAQPAKNRS